MNRVRPIPRFCFAFVCALTVLAALSQNLTAGVNFAQGIILRDSEIEDTLREYTDPLLKTAEIDPKSVRVLLINDSTMNAFATFGPLIVVNTGLILRCSRAEELVSVLAHEIGHIKARHLLGRMDTMKKATTPYLISAGLGALVTILTGNPAGLIAGAGLAHTMTMDTFLSFTRDQEMQADLISFSLLKKLGWPTSGTVSLFKKMDETHTLSYNARPVYTQTHPPIPERIEMAKKALDPAHQLPAQFNPDFERMKLKIFAYGNKPDVVRNDPNVLASPFKNYALAICDYRQGNFKGALAKLDALETERPSPYVSEFKAQIYFEQGDIAQAQAAINKTVDQLKRPHASIDILRARIAMTRPGEDTRAEGWLRKATRLEPLNPEPWYHLSIIAAKQRRPTAARICLMEYHLRLGHIKQVREMLAQAKKTIRPHDPMYVHLKDLEATLDALPKDKSTFGGMGA
jgi:predicted Zn-dependent protease